MGILPIGLSVWACAIAAAADGGCIEITTATESVNGGSGVVLTTMLLLSESDSNLYASETLPSSTDLGLFTDRVSDAFRPFPTTEKRIGR